MEEPEQPKLQIKTILKFLSGVFNETTQKNYTEFTAKYVIICTDMTWQKTADLVQEQVDGVSVFAFRSLHILSQLEQGRGGHLWNDTQFVEGTSKKWNIFTLVDSTSSGAKVGRVLRKLFG